MTTNLGPRRLALMLGLAATLGGALGVLILQPHAAAPIAAAPGGGTAPAAAEALPAIAQPRMHATPQRTDVASLARVGPRLRNQDTLWDWGTVVAGKDLEHTFDIHNDGDSELRIIRLKPT